MCRGRRARILLHLHIQLEGQSCEGAELVGVLVAETIHPACMCEGGAVCVYVSCVSSSRELEFFV
jgi:hypothetical protein